MKKRIIKKTIAYAFIGLLLLAAAVFIIDFFVRHSVKNNIVTDLQSIEKADCIIVLGAGIWGDRPSPMLEDRLDTAIELYKSGAADKLLMSGDHGREEYDEVNIMKAYAIENGVPSEDIFMDHAGFSTYDTVYRARAVFGVKSAVIVTQKYHLYRALYIADALNLEAVGVGADPRQYTGALYREMREILARDKDFIKCIFRPYPTFLGETIDILGDGNVTNDENSINYFETGE